MLVLERHQMIIQLLNQHNSLTVNELADMCVVSKETIRRDLSVLERKEMIVRSHGGAMLLSGMKNEPVFISKPNNIGKSFRQRMLVNVDAKTRIAKQAIKLIKPSDTIAIDSGSTCWFFARQIPNIDITVMTYSMHTINSLAAKRHVKMLILGGVYNATDEDMYGSITEKSLAECVIDKLFISCDGLDFSDGLGDNNEHHARLKQQLLLSAREVILLIDASKFNHSFYSKICNFGYIDVLITDKKMDAAVQKEADWHNVSVIVA